MDGEIGCPELVVRVWAPRPRVCTRSHAVLFTPPPTPGLVDPQEGSEVRSAPGGPLFALVSCPNYTAEVLSWVGFSIMTQVGVAYAFTALGECARVR